MNERWIVRLPASSVAALAALREFVGVECAVDNDQTWLRGADLDDRLQRVLHALPGGRQFERLEGDRLRPLGNIVPTERLPQLQWRPLATIVQPKLSAPALAGRIESKCALSLVRTTAIQTPNVLQTSLDRFAEYTAQTPQVRLQGCQFAVCADGRVIVRGEPLPPLDGQLFVERRGVAVPAGWRVEPALEPEILARALTLSAGDVGLLSESGPFERIPADAFAQVTRSAVRLTVERLSRV